MYEVKDSNEVEDKSEPYSLSERITLVSPDENAEDVSFFKDRAILVKWL